MVASDAKIATDIKGYMLQHLHVGSREQSLSSIELPRPPISTRSYKPGDQKKKKRNHAPIIRSPGVRDQHPLARFDVEIPCLLYEYRYQGRSREVRS
jgi:hypothetical protein